MLRNSSAVSRISFELNNEDFERRSKYGPGGLQRSTSSMSQVSEAESDEYDSWREEHPCALNHFDLLAAEAEGKLVAVFLDYDGTLTPIVSNPDAAYMPEQTRDAVRRVAELFPTAIVSGRGREKVESFVQLRQLFYAGSHGMDIVGPRASGSAFASAAGDNDRSSCDSGDCPAGATMPQAQAAEEDVAARFTFQPAAQFEPLMNAVYGELEAAVAPFPGSSVEHNKFCVSVHFRNCAAEDYPGVVAATEAVAAAHPQLHITRGRKVLEVRPQVDWDKGAALAHLLTAMGLDDPERVYAIYIGDDRTDEDAFKVLEDRGLGAGVLVSTRIKPTAGRWTLRDPTEVAAFLNTLVAWGRTEANVWHKAGSCVGWSMAPALQGAFVAPARRGGSGALPPQLLAGLDGMLVGQPGGQRRLSGDSRPGSGPTSRAGSGGLSAAAALLQRPPLPPKGPRRTSSGGPEKLPSLAADCGALSPTAAAEQQQLLQQRQANGSSSMGVGSTAPAACS